MRPNDPFAQKQKPVELFGDITRAMGYATHTERDIAQILIARAPHVEKIVAGTLSLATKALVSNKIRLVVG